MYNLDELASELDRRQFEFCQAYAAYCSAPSPASRLGLVDAQHRVDRVRHRAEQYFAHMR